MSGLIKSQPVPCAGIGEASTGTVGPLPSASGIPAAAAEADAPRLLQRPHHDDLTGLLTRQSLMAVLDAMLGDQPCARNDCAFLLVGIGNLSVTNEMFGLEVGDELIRAVGGVLKRELRDGEVLGRYSSNKFGIITGAAAMRSTVERLLKAVRDARLETSVCPLAATISVGGIVLPGLAADANEAACGALRALSRAKYCPGNGFSVYEPSRPHDEVRTRNIRVARDVVSALESGRMRMALQPIVSTATWQPALYECLLRMELPDGRTIAAGKFIGIAEQLGLAGLIDRRALELAVGILQEKPDLNLALNVSGLTCSDHGWLAALQQLTGGGLAERLTIEITETAAIQDFDCSISFVKALKQLGCRIAIDDFGAGYTSFRTLKHLDIDVVKIDGAFVRNLPQDRVDLAFVKAMVDLARSLELETVAEWVGDDATARLLARTGIDYLQGFHFGEPVIG